MVYVQHHFDRFQKRIRLAINESQTLRDKREIVSDRLHARLPRILEAEFGHSPEFVIRDQGSYQMGTGTFPPNRDFDIDLGIYFAIDHTRVHPVGLKQCVHAAVKGHTRDVRIRRPCVTVQYQSAGEPAYHVDIAIYADGSRSRDGLPRLALGKARSAEDLCVWEVSDPRGLSSEILGSFSGTELTQFRHVVRYLKRWKDHRFRAHGREAPSGIALTVASHAHFNACVFRDGSRDDLSALIGVVDGMLDSFIVRGLSRVIFGSRHDVRIELPVAPYSDLCERMTERQKAKFHREMEVLLDVLEKVQRGRNEKLACRRLHGVFGDDFPMPDR